MVDRQQQDGESRCRQDDRMIAEAGRAAQRCRDPDGRGCGQAPRRLIALPQDDDARAEEADTGQQSLHDPARGVRLMRFAEDRGRRGGAEADKPEGADAGSSLLDGSFPADDDARRHASEQPQHEIDFAPDIEIHHRSPRLLGAESATRLA